MARDLRYLLGRKFCVVLVRAEDAEDPDASIRLKCLHGRANVDRQGRLILEGPSYSFAVPSSTHHMIMPNDGTEMLQDAEYFVMCRVAGMEL